MPADLLGTHTAEHTAARVLHLPDGRSLRLALTVRLSTPGDACVAITSSVAFAYDPSLPDDVAVRLDDRLYDGIYDALALVEGALPPERLRVTVAALASDPPLAALLTPPDPPLVRAVGDGLAELAAAATTAAWGSLARALRADRP